VIASARLLSLYAAGLVALSSAAGPAAAHDAPSSPRHAHPAAPGPLTGEPGPGASTGVTSIRQLAAGDRTTLVGRVASTESHDEGKLLLHRVTVERTLRGSAGPSLAIVDIRAGLQRPPFLEEGQRAVLIVERAPSLSYLTRTLPEEDALYQLAGGREGVVPVATEADVEAVVAVLDAGRRIEDTADPVVKAQVLRGLAFGLLTTARARLVADGLVELRRLPRDLTLESEELETLRRVLRDRTLPVATRIGVIRLLGQRRWPGTLATLDAVDADRPEVLAALLEARAALGAPPTRKEIAPFLASDDPAVKAAAVAALARTGEPTAIAEVGRFATADGDAAVREAAIVALGESKRPEVAPYLRQTFASEDRALQQASARALLELDEPTGSAALSELALRAPAPDTRRYAALVLVLTRGRESAAVQRLLARNPDADVRHVLEHGFEMGHDHGGE
jgi:hypothetical protein